MFSTQLTKNSKNTRLIFRLDISLPIAYSMDQESLTEIAFQLCGSVKDYVAAIAIDSPFFIAVGPVNAEKITRKFNLPFIADFNLAETPEASLWIAEHAFNAGFDALVTHSFMGSQWLRELQTFSDTKEIIPVVGMNHGSAYEYMNPQTKKFCETVRDLNLKTIIAPSDQSMIENIRIYLPDQILLADSELATAGEFIRAGADFEMFGKTIHDSKDPEETALKLMEKLRETFK
ncbi:hypothetical protein K8R43_06295 [archaeon]|nr:hypothetical protein [archaeon]